jgi:hypothetical protein
LSQQSASQGLALTAVVAAEGFGKWNATNTVCPVRVQPVSRGSYVSDAVLDAFFAAARSISMSMLIQSLLMPLPTTRIASLSSAGVAMIESQGD